MNGHTIAFNLDRRLLKVEARWKAIRLLQDDLLDRFNSEHPPVWIHRTEDEPDSESSPPSQLLMP